MRFLSILYEYIKCTTECQDMWERKINDDIPVIGGKCVFIPAKTNYICPDGDDGTDVQVLYSFTIFTLHASKTPLHV